MKGPKGFTAPTAQHRREIFQDVLEERQRQLLKWGRQHRPEMSSHPDDMAVFMTHAKMICQSEEAEGPKPGYTGGASWGSVLTEELFEVLSEPDKAKRRQELIQVMAVCAAWIEDMDAHSPS